MKKSITASTIAILLLAVTYTQAQTQPARKRFYIKAAGGYFFSVSPGQFPKVGDYDPRETYQTYNTSTGETNVTSDRVLTGSYGAGVRAGLTGGFDINQYVAVELTANYYHSKTNLMTHQVTTAEGSTTVLGSVESHGHVNAFDLAPSLVLNPASKGKLNPYVRIGVVVPVWGRLYIETAGYKAGSVTGAPTYISQVTVQRKEAVKPNITVGFQGAFGATYKLTRRFDLFLEAEYRNVPVQSKSKEVTSYAETLKVINGATGATVSTSTRGLNDISTAERYTTYVTTLNSSSNQPTGVTDPAHPTQTQYDDNNRPANDLKSYINIGGLGLNLGLKVRI